jgi:hypothetical protein
MTMLENMVVLTNKENADILEETLISNKKLAVKKFKATKVSKLPRYWKVLLWSK